MSTQNIIIEVEFQGIILNVKPDTEHKWLLTTDEVAKGYGVAPKTIYSHSERHADELIHNSHYLILQNAESGQTRHIRHWTREGVIMLGFFIKSERAKIFRKWASKLILNHLESNPSNDLAALEAKFEKRIAEIQEVQDLRMHAYLQAIRDLSKRDTKSLDKYLQSLEKRLLVIEQKFAPLSAEARIAYVYLLRKIGTQECKIGKSVAPPSRVSAFEQAGVELELLSTIKFPNENSAFAFEKALKVIFKSKHLRGEWYLLAEQGIALFTSLAKVFAAWF